MSRWHAPSCSNPRVVVQQQRPYCESCDSHPDINALVAAEASKPSPIPFLPPDEPPGQMQLWWPPCVPYVTTGPDGHPVAVEPPQDHGQSQFVDQDESSEELDRLHIYHQRLKKDEFRVLCLTPVDDTGAPVHVSLEVYDDRYYPEYETVSYTWAGEDGDNSLCQPVYIGPYWDILLQTNNCWEMLKYLRPRRGVRTVWVDAICINQNDMQERQEQVAKMGRIYEKASRVVIYLGPDLVPPTSTTSPYPRRHHLQELDTLTEKPQLPSGSMSSHKELTLSDILSRNYFRRLWIIQELVMSRGIILRIGDTEFIVDQTLSSQEFPDHIPWFTFVTRKSIGDESGNSLRSAVELADASQASDPRDKIFGILGLIDSDNHPIVAAYSISFRHLVIGYYAYCLLIHKDIRVIYEASGPRALEGMPSWAPAAQYDASSNEALIPRTGFRQKHFFFMLRHNYRRRFGGHRFAMSHCFTDGDDRTCLEVPDEWNSQGLRNWGKLGSKSWHSHATIDSTTGGFNLSALHIMSFRNIDVSKAEIKSNSGVYMHAFKAGVCFLYLYANECILGPEDDPGKVHLFALCEHDESLGLLGLQVLLNVKATICVLQQINDQGKFRLLTSSVKVCFHVPRKLEQDYDTFDHIGDIDSFSYDHYRLDSKIFVAYDDKLCSPLPLLRSDFPTGICFDHRSRVIDDTKRDIYKKGEDELPIDYRKLTMSLSHPLEDPRQRWGLKGGSERYKYFFDARAPYYARFPNPRLAFPGVDHSVTLQIFQSLLNAERSGSSVEFFSVYFQAIRAFNPQLIQWKNRRNNTAADSSHVNVDVIHLVQLRFGPDQFDVLEEILDSIRNDIKMGIKLRLPKVSSIDAYHDRFNPPFLRIGWRDLALNQTDQILDNHGSNDEDVHGFYPLDVINETIDEHRMPDDEARIRSCVEDSVYNDVVNGRVHSNRMYDEAVDKDSCSDDSPGHGRNQRTFDDIVLREHRGQTIWVAFDLLSLTLWAQTHPCMTDLRGLSRFCKDGENEAARLIRPPTEEEKGMTSFDWPEDIMDNFEIGGKFRSITII